MPTPTNGRVLPAGVIYHSYLAGAKEPRFAYQWIYIQNQGWNWDADARRPDWSHPLWHRRRDPPAGLGVRRRRRAFPRLNLESAGRRHIEGDYRVGLPVTYGYGNYQMKLGYYHILLAPGR